MNRDNGKTICASHGDCKKLLELIAAELQGRSGLTALFLRTLQTELRHARVLSEKSLPPDVVALGKRVQVDDLDVRRRMMVIPVMPDDVVSGKHLSILAPLGLALFGYRAGDRVDWGPTEHLIRFRIAEVNAG